MPDELRAVHFDLDPVRTEDLADAWRRLGLSRLPLDLLECADRRLSREPRWRWSRRRSPTGRPRSPCCCPDGSTAACGTGSSTTAPPTRWPRSLSDLPHANVTIVPFHLGQNRPQPAPAPAPSRGRRARRAEGPPAPPARMVVEGAVPIGDLHERERTRIAGRVHTLRVQPWSGQPTLECTVDDGTGRMTVVFLGRRHIAGIEPGARIVVDGMVGRRGEQLVILNPDYRLLPGEAPAPTKKAGKH